MLRRCTTLATNSVQPRRNGAPTNLGGEGLEKKPNTSLLILMEGIVALIFLISITMVVLGVIILVLALLLAMLLRVLLLTNESSNSKKHNVRVLIF